MIKRVLIIKGAGQYDQFRYVCDEMLLSFTELGCLVTLLDMVKIDPSVLTTDLFDGYDLIFSFNAIGIDLYNSMNTRPLFWTFTVDPPFHIHPRLNAIRPDDRVIVSCIDRNHVDYIDKYYKNIAYTSFIPHGGITGENVERIPYKDRTYDVILMGSIGNLKEIDEVLSAAAASWPELINPIIDSAMFDIDAELHDIVLSKARDLQIELDSTFLNSIMAIFISLDALRRYYKRLALIKCLCDNGIFIDIWGNGWKDALAENGISENIKLHDSVSYNTAKGIMADARIILSDIPLFHNGSHERVFAAMQSGAVCATDRSIYLEECFEDDKNIVFYDTDNISELADRIKTLLRDQDKASSIIQNADKLTEFHTWKARAEAIIKIAEQLQV